MLLEIYKLIKKIENEIGNGAQVWFLAGDETITIRVYWARTEYSAMHRVSTHDLAHLVDDDAYLRYFVEWCKREYARKSDGVVKGTTTWEEVLNAVRGKKQ